LGSQLLGLVWASAVLGAAYSNGEVPDRLPIVVAVVANTGLWLGYFFGPMLVARFKGNGPVDDFGARLEARDVPVGLAIGIVLQLVVLPILYWPILRFVDGDPSEAARELLATVDTLGEWVVVAFSVVVVAPIVEELFYRGLFLRSVQRRLGSVAAVVLTALVFAVVHRQLLPLAGLFLFGVVAAFLVLYSGRLGPSWAMHVGFNATTLVVLGLGG
jgi:membrane protease YdiL (CAAX protease family)